MTVNGKVMVTRLWHFLRSFVFIGIFILYPGGLQAQAPLASSHAATSDSAGLLVSNVFFETDLRQALKDLSNEAGIPIIADNSVQGLVTLEFNDQPLESVLRKILAGNGFTFRKIEDYYLVGSPHPENPAFPLLTETTFYRPDYLLAEQIPLLMPDYYRPFIRVNDKTNSIAITAAPEIIVKIKQSISQFDPPPPQILIEAVITELSKEALTSLGLDWNWQGQAGAKNLGLATNFNSIVNDSSFIGRFVRTGVNFKSFQYNILYQIKALATEGKAKIKANPKITTINGREASIFIGSERYFSIITGPVNYPYTRLERIPAGITLKIIPLVSSKNEITASVECEVSEVSEIGISGLPLVTKRNAKTDIRVKDGEIIAIGGLIQETDIKTQKKIPFLGNIPLIGYLFSHTKTDKVTREIAIFIAPHLVTQASSTIPKPEEKR